MSFNPGGGGIASASDVALSNPATGNFLKYDGTLAKWQNNTLSGAAALPTGGGMETVSTANATGSTTVNLTNGNVFNLTLTGNATFTFSGATIGKACSFGLYLHQDATGGRSVTWPTAVKWSGAVAPTLSTAASAVDILAFETIDGGTTWYGSLVGTNFS